METLLDVVRVEAQPGNILVIDFENGERRRFDMTPYLTRRPFQQLSTQSVFLCARVDNGTVGWPGNIDIAPETLYLRSTPMNP
ncbi:MAG: DUF2442 domain-containing protein [Holophagaceae bacterium]|nr:DUF2442 domain-containing protein [Holophagaceae bacterium]